AAPGSADEISTREVVGPRAFLGCTRVVAARRDEVLEGHAAERGTGPTGRQQLLVFARRLDEVDVSPGIDEHRGEVLETQLRRLEHRLAEKLIPPQLLEPRGSQEFEAGLSVDFGAEWTAAQGIDAPGAHRLARDLVLRVPPVSTDGAAGSINAGAPAALVRAGETAQAAAVRLVLDLARAARGASLPIQGPPGSGKTHTGAEMVLALVDAGFKVGVSGPSHKVIGNLL